MLTDNLGVQVTSDRMLELNQALLEELAIQPCIVAPVASYAQIAYLDVLDELGPSIQAMVERKLATYLPLTSGTRRAVLRPALLRRAA